MADVILKVNDKEQMFNACTDHQIEMWIRSRGPEVVMSAELRGN